MTQRIYFWCSVIASVAVVFLFGMNSINHHIRSLQVGNVLDGVPVEEVTNALDEFRSRSVSSANELKVLFAEHPTNTVVADESTTSVIPETGSNDDDQLTDEDGVSASSAGEYVSADTATLTTATGETSVIELR